MLSPLIESWTQASAFNHWVFSSAIFLVALFIGFAVKRIVWSRLERMALASENTFDDMLVQSLSLPARVLVFIAAFGVAGQSAAPDIRTHPLVKFGVKVALIVVAFWILERIVTLFFRSTVLPQSFSTTTRTLFATIARTVLLSIGLLIVLDTLGISITPVLASLGVGSVAVALALQDTLSNFFGGLYLLVDKPIRIGDYVQIDDIDGVVDKIGWRSTRIHTPSDIVVTVPNSVVAGAKLRNFDLPFHETNFSIQLGVAYGSDLQRVERVVIEVAKEVLARIPEAVTNAEPSVRFHTFADSSINFSVGLRVKTYVGHHLVKHEFIKAIHERFAHERIDIPFPHRVLHVVGERQESRGV